jgi:hypothetical protein
VWLIATTTVIATCIATGYAPFAPSTWSRWDSGLYLDIARHGYTLFHCSAPYDPAHDWCGNAGWFPAYPWLLRALHTIGLPLTASAVAVSWIFSAGTIVLSWFTFLRARPAFASIGCLAFMAFAPGQVFFYAIYPLSMLTFLVVAHLWLLTQDRWAAAGIAGAAAALTYPLGVMVIPAAALWLVLSARPFRSVVTVVGLTLLGPLVLVVDQKLEVGRFDAYLLVQKKYGHALQDPLAPVINAFSALHDTRDVQTIFVALVVVSALTWLAVWRRRASSSDLLIGIWSFASWLLPNLQANLSLVRSQAALAPIALLLRRFPRPILALCVAMAIGLSVPVTRLFLDGKLV